MVVEGPFGPQISGGTNLGEDPAGFYLPEGQLYYDGEDTSSMLAPIYGACSLDWQPWINYHRFARSLWCPTFDPEFGMLNWFPSEPAVQDGTAFFSRLGGSVTLEEMKEGVSVLRRFGVDDVTGSVFWWPHGLEYKRSLTRCSQGQGAWAWQYLQQWLGLQVDRNQHLLILAPQGLVTDYSWAGFRSGDSRFDITWEETVEGSRAHVANPGPESWTLRVGFRAMGSGALGDLVWQEAVLPPQGEAALHAAARAAPIFQSMPDAAIRRQELSAFGQESQMLFRRYGPAMLWGNWDASRLWQPSALPNALRFLVFNGSPKDWVDVRVTLSVPPGWQAQARQPGHWERPDRLQSGLVDLPLGPLACGRHTVAPFWIREEGGVGLLSPIASGGFGSEHVSSHTPSQPGAGLALVSPCQTAAREFYFIARLRAVCAGGKNLAVELDVPVMVFPAQAG
jgi:hypothetical protein